MNTYGTAYADDMVTLLHGDCRVVMACDIADASVDAIVTDPPYELAFMGKGWDASGIAYDADVWANAYRVLKPGGHLLAFGGTRTWHRLAVAIEDAGFEVRDSMAWLYGSGFPKSLDVSKAIDKAAGAEREIVGQYKGASNIGKDSTNSYITQQAGHATDVSITAPATPAAQQWQGWGTALKPAFEPIVVARKPLIGTVAENVLTHGTGALNIDGCRVANTGSPISRVTGKGTLGGTSDGYDRPWKNDPVAVAARQERADVAIEKANTLGRWPANVILDESQAAELDRQSGVSEARQSGWSKSGSKAGKNDSMSGDNYARDAKPDAFTDCGGGASRFFYVAKANSAERPRDGATAHPTVKPLDLMRYLVKLVTPPGGTVLEPFAGSGTTVEACLIEGFRCIAIELTDEYLPLIQQRISKPIEQVLL